MVINRRAVVLVDRKS